MRPLKILQVFSRYLYPGGEERSVARMAEDLESGGHQVLRFWRESAEWQGAAAPARWRQPGLLWRNAAVLNELEQLHRGQAPDLWLLHNVLPVVSLDVYRLARSLGVPVVQWLHNYRPVSPSGTLLAGTIRLEPEDPWIPWKETWAGAWHGRLLTAWLALGYARLKRRGDFEAVRAWVAISEDMKSMFQRARWFPERLYALRHSWHPELAAPSGQDEGYFLFLGRLVDSKGVRFLVDLWRDPALKGISLVVAGQGPLQEELRALSLPNVQWPGHVAGAAKHKLLAGCRAVVIPGLWEEPLGLVTYEAYDHGKPVLASRLGGIRETVEGGVTGLLLEPGNLGQWREAVLGLTRGRAQELGLAGRRWLENNTSPAHWNEQFRVIVREVLGA